MLNLHVERDEGSDANAPVLLLLHGLGQHAGVWAPLITALRPGFAGTVIAPDLRGHGRSPWCRHYGYGQQAADVADLLNGETPLYIAGHSMGGVIAVALASGLYGVKPKSVFAFGTKLQFSAVELDKGRAYAESPVRWLDTQQEAATRFLKGSGLHGMVEADSAIALAGVHAVDGRYRVATDPRCMLAAEGPGLPSLSGLAQCPVSYACGPKDPMVTLDGLRALAAPKGSTAQVMEITGAGHNAHLENPQQMAEMLLRWLDQGA